MGPLAMLTDTLSGTQMMIVIVVIGSCLAGVIKTIAVQSRKFACHRQELLFKHELIDRGMTAEEVEQIVRARDAVVEPPGAAKIGCTAR